MHWAKVVTEDGRWKWIKPHQGIRGRLVRDPPLHVYQTVLSFLTSKPPDGRRSKGLLLRGPLLLEADLIQRGTPFNLWRIVDACDLIRDASETVDDRLGWKLKRAVFSGSRGIHLTFASPDIPERPLRLSRNSIGVDLRNYIRERRQIARSMGYWRREWDWEVTSDIWRVARVPWSVHGLSALRVLPLEPPYEPKGIVRQLREASPFSFDRKLRVRMKRHVPPFTFIDEQTYGPYPKQWVTKLPLAVAIHLFWGDLAKPAEKGPTSPSGWFESGWRILVGRNPGNGARKQENPGGFRE